MRVQAVGAAALFSIVVPLFASACILVAGRIARGNRKLLAALFVPGFYATALLLTLLVVLHAAIAVMTLWSIAEVYTGTMFLFVMVVIAIGGLVAFVANVRSLISVIKPPAVAVPGIPVSDSQCPRLWKLVREIAAALGTQPPDNIVLGTEPTFYVVDVAAVSLVGPLSRRTLYCSTSLSRILTDDELKAVVGHELAHFAGDDLVFTRRFGPIYHGLTEALVNMSSDRGGGFFVRLAQLPAQAIYAYLLFAFAKAEREIARSRELEADRSGAAIATPEALATALIKLHAFQVLWSDVQDEIVESMGGNEPVHNAGELFADWAREYATPGALQDLANLHTAHPIDTHPALGERLQSLGVTLEVLTNSVLDLKLERPATELMNDFESLELAITEAHRYLLANLARRTAPANDAMREAG